MLLANRQMIQCSLNILMAIWKKRAVAAQLFATSSRSFHEARESLSRVKKCTRSLSLAHLMVCFSPSLIETLDQSGGKEGRKKVNMSSSKAEWSMSFGDTFFSNPNRLLRDQSLVHRCRRNAWWTSSRISGGS